MIEFFMPMVPPKATYQTSRAVARGGKVVRFPSAAWQEARGKLEAALVGHHTEPMIGALRLTCKIVWPSQKPAAWKSTRPDIDNLMKGLIDCMTRLGFWHDDAQVASLVAEKSTGPKPGIYVRVEQL